MTLTLFDLDGVIRRWDDSPSAIERAHALPAGTISTLAFEPELLMRAVTGALRDEAWRARVAMRLVDDFGVDGDAIVAEWSASIGSIDADVLDVVRDVRVHGAVGILTNATSRVRADLEALGVSGEFDVVYSSAELGVAKPDPAVFERVVAHARVAPDDVFFLDDTDANVAAARAAGWQAEQFLSAAQVRTVLARVGRLRPARG